VSVEKVLSDFVSQVSTESIPEAARAAAEIHVFDAIGVSIAAAGEPSGKAVARFIADLGAAPQARVLGNGLRASVVHAAWANGTLAHVLDFDDIGFSHPTACIYPAALAVAEHTDCTGREFLDAMVLGYEVFERLAASSRRDSNRVRFNGYHPTPFFGAMAAAAASGRILGLKPEQLAISLGLAAADISGLVQQFGSWGKGLHAGNAARSGTQASLLARVGYRGDMEGLSGPYGFYNAMHGPGKFDFSKVPEGLGERWAIVDPGLSLKPYPACGGVRKGVAAAIRARRHPKFNVDDITAVHIHVHPNIFHTVRFKAPHDGHSGKFSLDYSVASALLDGALTIDSFSDASASRPELRRLLSLVEFKEHPEWDSSHPQGTVNYKQGTPIDVFLADGTVVSELVTVAHGTPADPMTESELINKYLDCARRMWSDDVALRSMKAMRSIGQTESIRDIVDLACPVSAGADQPGGESRGAE
jgi:2-methylcitrate dehydratase PrpD